MFRKKICKFVQNGSVGADKNVSVGDAYHLNQQELQMRDRFRAFKKPDHLESELLVRLQRILQRRLSRSWSSDIASDAASELIVLRLRQPSLHHCIEFYRDMIEKGILPRVLLVRATRLAAQDVERVRRLKFMPPTDLTVATRNDKSYGHVDNQDQIAAIRRQCNPRQESIVSRILTGQSLQDIARELGISRRTLSRDLRRLRPAPRK